MDEARYRELKEKLAALKSLYASRHYSQCAKFGELLLSEMHDQTHPLHLAHLNFYTALSHDTLAREATLKNRWRELSVAELHYNAAIVALSSSQSPMQCDLWSPTSSGSAVPSPYSRRRTDSMHSERSAASSATSLGDEDDECLEMSPGKFASQGSDEAVTRDEIPTIPSTSATPTTRPQTPQQFYFSANMASFADMVAGHLADVREQKLQTGMPTVRFTMPSARPSPTKATGHSRCLSVDDSTDGDEAAMEAIRASRRQRTFRPRFDPASVQRLCREALVELSG
ncbi:uncharacterized protein EKO05_0002270 [Ascochyta rabiei]|uniref:Uncharacterized protein n=1 Tax=Didymella rabiei TaxID=5454 RepID=A0A163KT01_DIDRA|nr:uncharacterized protein EKO05_0002270 [Ascochyta rabiei]KZM27226.1 hypothetical protein ST47_g1640 [Ascochyta rabiei]UPX11676.1 hypothetical protein EKO05_0002270 [Ascochyta rabiei]